MKLKHILLAPEEDAGSTAVVDAPPTFRSLFGEAPDEEEEEEEEEPPNVENEEEEEEEKEEEEPKPEVKPLADTAPPPTVQIEEAIRKGFESLRPVEQGNRTPPQLSPEESARILGTFRPDQKYVAAMFDPDLSEEERVTVVQDFVDKTVRNAVQSAAVLVNLATEELRKEFHPAVENVQQQTVQSFHRALETKFPALKGRGNVVDFVAAQLKQQGFSPRSFDEAVEAVGKRGEQFLKELGVSPVTNKPKRAKPAQLGKPTKGAAGAATEKPEAWMGVFNRKK